LTEPLDGQEIVLVLEKAEKRLGSSHHRHGKGGGPRAVERAVLAAVADALADQAQG
jgi:hypothetical protein